MQHANTLCLLVNLLFPQVFFCNYNDRYLINNYSINTIISKIRYNTINLSGKKLICE
jgi:hypothetical protein